MSTVARDEDHWEVQLRKGSLELAVLASLWSSRLYGLEIIGRLDASVGLAMPEGTIYPLLARLEANDMVASEWGPGSGARARKYYILSDTGRRRVVAMKEVWLRHAVSLAHLVDPIGEEMS